MLESKYTARDVERFWSKVDQSGGPGECWPWTAARKRGGYGMFRVGNGMRKASRVALELTCGSVPPGLFVCHSCDNPPCCNPAHLWAGTAKDNHTDMIAKGRGNRGVVPGGRRRGEENGRAHLTEAGVRDILVSCARGETQESVARRHRVARSQVGRIVRGENWIHVSRPLASG